jgi:hypothetical protein
MRGQAAKAFRHAGARACVRAAPVTSAAVSAALAEAGCAAVLVL